MKNVIIDLYDISFKYIVEKIIENQIYTVLGVIPFIYCSDRSKFGLDDSVEIYSTNNQIKEQYDVCIILNNKNIKSEAAYKLVEDYLCKSKSIDCYYSFNEEEIKKLRIIADKNKVKFTPLASWKEPQNKSMNNIDIPVIYISGLQEQCDILTTHLLLDSVLSNQGYKTINISNSPLAHIFNYISIDSLYNPSFNNYFNAIENIKEKVFKEIERTESNILIISNINNFIDFEDYIVNYGFDNFILKSAFDFDYIIYNIPVNMLIGDLQKIMDYIKKEIKAKTNDAEVIFGASHIILDKYFDDNYYFLRIQNDEYNYCLNKCNTLFENIIDTASIKDITKYFSKN